METKKEIREFLTSRRAGITPEQAGLPTYGARRVPGLRREGVAVLAGVSVPYYTRLERGDMSGASEGVLEALARGAPARRGRARPPLRPRPRRPADRRAPASALVQAAHPAGDPVDARRDHRGRRVRGQRPPGHPGHQRTRTRALLRAVRRTYPAGEPRTVRLPRSTGRGVLPDWDRAARETAAILRSAAGGDPYERDLSDLVGELATQSEPFRTHWAMHNVRFHVTAVKQLHHPVVGELSLRFNRLDIAADHGLTMFTYAVEPGSRSEEALNLLGSWAATVDLAESARTTDQS